MAKLSKRLQAFATKVDRMKLYPVDQALSLVKECASAKFDESIDVAVQLGIDAKKSDQVVRGSVVLPAGPASRFAWLCLLRAKRPSKRVLPALKSSAWKIWPSRSRPVI